MSGDLGDQAIKELRLFIKPTSGFTPKIMEMQIAYPGRRDFWRRGRESNPSKRLCRPLHNLFATSPEKLANSLWE
jgi:hypothetical protein